MLKIVADAHIPFVKDYFLPYGELILKPGRAITPADVKDADILLVRSVTQVNENLLADSAVKFVGSVTAGTDHLDIPWLEQAGINWCIATGFNAPPVSDYVVSIISALQKYKVLGTQRPKAAIVGVGNVGQLVMEKLKLLEFDVILCDPIRAQMEKNFSHTPLEEIHDVDLISLHVPLSHAGLHPTYHFINSDFFAKQKSGCVLLNTSRGAVIDSEELMKHGQHLQWCFDVWEHEPKINKDVLEHALIATPHIAGYSVQSKIRGIDMIYRIACDRGVVPPQSMNPITMPEQQLRFAGKQYWRDIVLGIFNPIVITEMMRATLLPASEIGSLFDEMRHQFNYRYEFGFTTVDALVQPDDRRMLENLNINLHSSNH